MLLLLGISLARFDAGSVGVARAASSDGAEGVATAITLTIPLATFDDVRRLDGRQEIADVMRLARTYSDSPIFLAAYVTADDVRGDGADAPGVSIADQLIIEVGGYLAERGVEADRISGMGMGIDPAIGRAVVVSFAVAAQPWDPIRRPFKSFETRWIGMIRTAMAANRE